MSTAIMALLPFALVHVVEHVALTRWYGKPSSLQRLLRPRSDSSRADLTTVLLVRGVLVRFSFVTAPFTLPGLALLALAGLNKILGWPGLLHGLMPQSLVVATVVWLVAVDFTHYAAHVAMHRVPALWHVHKLHHAATDMNISTGSRLSFGEQAWYGLTGLIVMRIILGLPSPDVVVAVMFIRTCLDLLQHSDLPWDYGWLGYLVVSPRYHRLHHSADRRDGDANYADLFPCWDYVFDTVADRYRSRRATADDCGLGLFDQDEGAAINRAWLTAPLHASFLDRASLAAAGRWVAGARAMASRRFSRAPAPLAPTPRTADHRIHRETGPLP